jgi:hypothetical protein
MLRARDILDGIANLYGLDVRGFRILVGARDFLLSAPAQIGPAAPSQPPAQWIPGLLPGGKAAAAWC